MYTPEGIRDVLQRVQHGNINLLAHCRQLSDEELTRELPGIGFPTVIRQLFHAINAEQYWLMVLRGRFADGATLTEQEQYDWTPPNFVTIAALEDYRERVNADTMAYLGQQTAVSLLSPAVYAVDPGIYETQIPAHVLMRVATHYFHHRGLTAAMCRMLGYPVPEAFAFLDYPLHAAPPFD